MGVHNTTGQGKTLFVCGTKLVESEAYATYCRTVGNQDDNAHDRKGLIRPGGWYAVDAWMILNSMVRGKGSLSLMRMQQCAPPMSAKKEVFSYMDAWYKVHDLSSCVIVLTMDGRRCPFKMRNAEERTRRAEHIRARDAATTFTELERHLKQLVTIDGDILHWLREWIKERKYEDQVMCLGAPFEADAQMVQLELQGIVDGIFTDDIDTWFLGGTNILKGFTKRRKGPYAAILGGTVRMCAFMIPPHTPKHHTHSQCDYDELNALNRRQKAVLSVLCGNDYVNHLQSFTLGQKPSAGKRGRAFKAMRHYTSLEESNERRAYMESLERDNRWSDGESAPAIDFLVKFCRALGVVYHYPVYQIVFGR